MTDDERIHRVLDRLATNRADPATPLGHALSATSVDILELGGAGITLQVPGGDPQSIGASNAHMAALHELERTLGEGPCVDAFNRNEPVAEPDLAGPGSTRWPGFTAGALGTDARAAFGYPMRIGAARFGALNLYADRPGGLTDDQHADALVLADVATHTALAAASTGPEALAGELLDVGSHQVELHQATGMISVQLSVGVADALARLRAHAFAEDRPLSTVAADVVARRLRFEP